MEIGCLFEEKFQKVNLYVLWETANGYYICFKTTENFEATWSIIALVAARLGQFCENFENTGENLSLILLGLMRLHIEKCESNVIVNFAGGRRVLVLKREAADIISYSRSINSQSINRKLRNV